MGDFNGYGYTYVYQGTGSLSDMRGPEDAPRPPLRAVLWLPDPEQRHGWREHYVRAKSDPKAAPDRSLGFHQPGKPSRKRR